VAASTRLVSPSAPSARNGHPRRRCPSVVLKSSFHEIDRIRAPTGNPRKPVSQLPVALDATGNNVVLATPARAIGPHIGAIDRDGHARTGGDRLTLRVGPVVLLGLGHSLIKVILNDLALDLPQDRLAVLQR